MAGDSEERLTLKDIAALLKVLKQYEVTEFELERDGEKISLKRGVGENGKEHATHLPQQLVTAVPAVTHQVMAPPPAAAPETRPSAASSAGGEAARGESGKVVDIPPPPESGKPVRSLREVTSPMVGTFYRRPAVDADPYVQVGDTIKKGQVLCIVEAMKLMNEIESEYAGRIAEVCLEDGQMVEYGEVLFRIEPL